MTPDRTTFIESTDRSNPVVAHVAVDLDLETTPLAAYAALTGRSTGDAPAEYAFLLESAEKTASSDPDGAFRPTSATADRHARYSFVGYDPETVVTVGPDETTVEALGDERVAALVERGATTEGDTLDALRGGLPDVERVGFPETGRQHLDGGLVGFLAYDAVYDLWLSEVGRDRPDSPLPDAQFVLNTRTLAFDEVEETLSLVFTPIVFPDDDPGRVYDALVAETERVRSTLAAPPDPDPGGFVRERERTGPKAEYEDAVRRAKERVLDGEIYQGVVSRRRELDGEIDPLGLYAALRDVNPSPYMYLLAYDDLTIVGASPETLVSVRDDLVTSNPIAGTCARGSSPVEDRRLAGEMLADDKERAEHTMLVDLARNDVRRVADAGSVRVDEFMNVLKYSHVQHIESTVTGHLGEDVDAFDATRATFPAGTLAGAPKIRAMEIIDELESEPRGVYGGGVGYYSWTGDVDMAIVIRTATIDHDAKPRRGGSEGFRPSEDSAFRDDTVDRITVRAGAGLVADSDPTAEYEETEKKMDGVLAALRRIERPPEVKG